MISDITHLGVTSDWAMVDVTLLGLGITILGILWRIAVKAAKRDEVLKRMEARFTTEFGGNGNGIRQQVDQIVRVQAEIREDITEIKADAKYQTARFDEHIAAHAEQSPRRTRRTA